MGAAVVPPCALVVGGAVEDLEAQVGVLQADAHQLGQVLRRYPDRQTALVERLVADVADPEAEHAQAVLVGIERAQRLAERLAHAIAGVGAHGDVDADVVKAGVEADGMIGGGEDHALDALAPRRLEQIVAADDVGLQDRLPRPFDGVAPEMNDALDAVDRLLDLLEAGKVGSNEGLVGPEIGRLLDVAQAQLGVDRLQELAQATADVAGRTGQ
jgi:hypothetical protein